ncbi:hypothetical protein FRUB_09114 [Fimbriiglobus ruber]|uniref:Uncharacterized protein n=1 Tax=Fimbriiglobus ruber TaxID=1908690 RepID=A0A225D4M4_9BACT|nr:hypothetical protein FRUB_09114 [Fimbriiglobus ruber]
MHVRSLGDRATGEFSANRRRRQEAEGFRQFGVRRFIAALVF